MTRSAVLPILAVLGGASCIALGPVCAVLAGDWGDLEPAATAFWRVFMAMPVLLGLALLWGQADLPRRKTDWWWLLLPGLLFAGDLASWHAAMTMIAAGMATVLANLAAVLVPILAWLLLGERFGRQFIIGTAITLGGTLVVLLPASGTVAASLPGSGLRQWTGGGLGLVTAICYAGYQLAIKRARRDHRTIRVMCYATIACAGALWLWCFLTNCRLTPSDHRAWWPIVGMGLVAHCLGQGLLAWALGRLPAASVAVVVLWQPLLATLLGWILLGQQLSGLQILGMALIGSGLPLVITARVVQDRARTGRDR